MNVEDLYYMIKKIQMKTLRGHAQLALRKVKFRDWLLTVQDVKCYAVNELIHSDKPYNKNLKCCIWKQKHITGRKMGVSVLLRLFISSNEVYNIAYALLYIHEQNSIFKDTTMGSMIPKEMKI